jgi:hypothetical protein
MIKYHTAETAVGAHITTWMPSKARSFEGAKRAAQACRMFQGTEAHVGQLLTDGTIQRIATRRPSSHACPGWTA